LSPPLRHKFIRQFSSETQLIFFKCRVTTTIHLIVHKNWNKDKKIDSIVCVFRSNRSNISGDEEDSGLYILENGAEFSLTPLNKRKYAFEPYSGSRSGTRDHRRTQRRLNRQEEPGREDLKGLVYSRGVGAVKSPVEVNILPGPVNYVRSSQVPYIEEEKSILENINIVRSAKQRFLN